MVSNIEMAKWVWDNSLTTNHVYTRMCAHARARALGRARVSSNRARMAPALEIMRHRYLAELVALCEVDRDLLARYNLPMIEI